MRHILIISAFSMWLMACGNKNNSQDPKQELLENIQKIEKELLEKNRGKFNDALARQLVTFYEAFAENNPQDTLVPEVLFKCGEVYIGLREFDKATQKFEAIYQYHTEYNKRVEALFMCAFVYDEHLKVKGKAGDLYQKLIDKHPSHPFAEMAAQMLENLNLSDEEIIRKFEAVNGTKGAVNS